MSNPTVTIPQSFKVTHEQFKELAIANRDIRLERTATGELIVIPWNESETGAKIANINGQLWIWNHQTKLGIAFNSSTGFHLPNSANRSTDASWIKLERCSRFNSRRETKFCSYMSRFRCRVTFCFQQYETFARKNAGIYCKWSKIRLVD